MKRKDPIKVVLVDDSPIALAILKRILSTDEEIEIVGTAMNGKDALDVIRSTLPDVICTDLHMPRMNGLELTRIIMAELPRPILVISSAVQAEDKQNVFQLLEAGAVDVFPKPRGGLGLHSDYDALSEQLIQKIKTAYTLQQSQPAAAKPAAAKPTPLTHPASDDTRWTDIITGVRVVAIGASTGGPQAVKTILTQLPFNFPAPIICVLHLTEGFLGGLVDWLAARCKLKVRIAQGGESPMPRTVYFPPEGKHLEVDNAGRFVVSSAPPHKGHRPSITVTFNSIAHHYGADAVGIILTGIGSDGVEGMKSIHRSEGITIVQDEASSMASLLPKQVIELGIVSHVVPLDNMVSTLMAVLAYHQ